MEVEDVARVCLTARRAAQDQRHLAVGHGLLREVVVDNEGVAPRVAEEFADGCAREGGEVLHGSRIGGRGGHDDRILHGSVPAQRLDERRHGRGLLADSHIDAVDRVTGLEVAPLVDDRVHGDGRLARLAVADDQLALTAADRDHRIDGLQARLQGFAHRLAEDDARRLAFQRHLDRLPADGTLAVERIAQRRDHPAEQRLTHLDRSRMARPAHEVALLDQVRGSQQHGTDVILLEVHHHGLDAVLELEQFVRFGVPESVDADHSVAHLQRRADLGILCLEVDALQFGKQDVRNFRGFYGILVHN